MAKKTKVVLDSPEVKELADRIAGLLGETDKKAIFSIRAMIGVNDSNFALEQLVLAAKLKRDGITMKTDDGKKYRTVGGMWFKLCKDKMSSSKRYRYMRLTAPNKRDGKRRTNHNGR